MKPSKIRWIEMLMTSMLTKIRRENGKRTTEALLRLVTQQKKMNVREKLRERETEKTTIEHNQREIVQKQDLTEILLGMSVVMTVRELLRNVRTRRTLVVHQATTYS